MLIQICATKRCARTQAEATPICHEISPKYFLFSFHIIASLTCGHFTAKYFLFSFHIIASLTCGHFHALCCWRSTSRTTSGMNLGRVHLETVCKRSKQFLVEQRSLRSMTRARGLTANWISGSLHISQKDIVGVKEDINQRQIREISVQHRHFGR